MTEIRGKEETTVVDISTPSFDIETNLLSFSIDAPFLDSTWSDSQEFNEYDNMFVSFRNKSDANLHDTKIVQEERFPFSLNNEVSGVFAKCVDENHLLLVSLFADFMQTVLFDISHPPNEESGSFATICPFFEMEPPPSFVTEGSANEFFRAWLFRGVTGPPIVSIDNFVNGANDVNPDIDVSEESVLFKGEKLTKISDHSYYLSPLETVNEITGASSDGRIVLCPNKLLIPVNENDSILLPRNGGIAYNSTDEGILSSTMSFEVNVAFNYSQEQLVVDVRTSDLSLHVHLRVNGTDFYRTSPSFCALESDNALETVPREKFGFLPEIIEDLEIPRHPIVMQYFDLYPSSRTETHGIPRNLADIGSCASSFARINNTELMRQQTWLDLHEVFKDKPIGYDDWLRYSMNDLSVYVTENHPSQFLFSANGSQLTYNGFPNALRVVPMFHKLQNESFVTRTITYSDNQGRHMINMQFEASLQKLARCKYRNLEGSLDDAVIVHDTDTSITYDIYPTWVQLYPRRLNGIPGIMKTYSKEYSITVSKSSRMMQVVDSGRDLHAQVLSIKDEVGIIKGCPSDTQGRLSFEIELTHAKANSDDDNEVVGIHNIASILKFGEDCYDFPTSNQNLIDLENISQPDCPLNSPFCYQIVTLTTSCYELDEDGGTFVNGCANFNFASKVRSCPSKSAWDSSIACVDSPDTDKILITAKDHYVYPLSSQNSADAIRLQLELSIFSTPNVDSFDQAITSGSGSAELESNEREFARFTADQYITLGVRPAAGNNIDGIPVVLTDVFICKGSISSLHDYVALNMNTDEYCVSEFTGITILRNNQPVECGNSLCIESNYLPRSIDDPFVLPSNNRLCQDYGSSCDMLAFSASHVVDTLGYTDLGDAFLIETVSYVGSLKVQRRRLVESSEQVKVGIDDPSFCAVQIVEDVEEFETQLQIQSADPNVKVKQTQNDTLNGIADQFSDSLADIDDLSKDISIDDSRPIEIDLFEGDQISSRSGSMKWKVILTFSFVCFLFIVLTTYFILTYKYR